MPGFDTFWGTREAPGLYPHPRNRGSRQLAQERWDKLKDTDKHPDKADCCRGLGPYKDYIRDKDGYQPVMAEVWINKRRWEGYLESEAYEPYVEPRPKEYRPDLQKYLHEITDMEWKVSAHILKLYGDVTVKGPVYGGVEMSFRLAPENAWMNLLPWQERCRTYLKLKLKWEDGWGGEDRVKAARADIMPTLADVAKAKAAWPAINERGEKIAQAKERGV